MVFANAIFRPPEGYRGSARILMASGVSVLLHCRSLPTSEIRTLMWYLTAARIRRYMRFSCKRFYRSHVCDTDRFSKFLRNSIDLQPDRRNRRDDSAVRQSGLTIEAGWVRHRTLFPRTICPDRGPKDECQHSRMSSLPAELEWPSANELLITIDSEIRRA